MTADIETIRRSVEPLFGEASDYDGLIERCEKAKVVLLGEATHGTHEFYEARAEITKRLIEELGLKNHTVGAARVSEIHGNFIVNDGGASAADILALIREIQQVAEQKRGIRLETEVQITGVDL